MDIKQLVPSETCLKCDGCCRFKAIDSPWRPKLGAGERQSLAMQITGQDWLDTDGHIKSKEESGSCNCVFYNSSDHSCRIYHNHPFECKIYPYILSHKKEGGIALYMHLSCPFIQDHLNTSTLKAYGQYLREFFQQAKTRAWLKDNMDLVHDYSAYHLELEHVFDI